MQQFKDPTTNDVSERAATGEQEETINRKKEELIKNKLAIKEKIQQHENEKTKMVDTFTKELKENADRYHQELEEKKNQYSQKMLEDAARY